MLTFEIKCGFKNNLIDENNLPKIELTEGFWYLTLDTAEVYVAINNSLKKINEADINLEMFNERFGELSAKIDVIAKDAARREVYTYAQKSEFPNIGTLNVLYNALDTKCSYIFDGSNYICVGSDYKNIEIINGGKP